MNKEELEKEIGSNTLSAANIQATTLANIGKFVKVSLLMDKDSLDYYYEIDVDELLSSKMPTMELGMLKKGGWSFSKDKKKIIVFLIK